jgi:hypothetical protein
MKHHNMNFFTANILDILGGGRVERHFFHASFLL